MKIGTPKGYTMTLTQIGVIALAFAAGIAADSLLRGVESAAPAPLQAGAADTSNVGIDRIRGEYERQIAHLTSQLENAGLQPQGVHAEKPAALSIDRRIAILEELQRGGLESYKKQQADKLLAAGFTKERVEWLRKRSEELAAEWIQTDDRLRQQGKFDLNATLSHSFDKDIGLRQELGDDEYARYRQALGRGIGLKISEPIPGGIGERAGIKPGDQIIAYNGVRIFNPGDLVPLMTKYTTSGTSIPIDVLRDGKTVRLNAEGGDLRIHPTLPVMSVDELEWRKRGMAK